MKDLDKECLIGWDVSLLISRTMYALSISQNKQDIIDHCSSFVNKGTESKIEEIDLFSSLKDINKTILTEDKSFFWN